MLTSTSLGLAHAAVRVAPAMMAAPVADGAVDSWYDSGIRLATGVVVPTKMPPAAAAATAAPAAPAFVPPASLAGSRPAYVWNPKLLTVDGLPEELKPFKDQFVPEFVTGVPKYLDGTTYQGDRGFDPWALVALADQKPDQLMSLLSAKERTARLEAMSAEEQATAVAWMREAELKHARLAMLAAAGWPMAELLNPIAATGGRAPSLFNGQLIENALPVALLFGGLAFLEVQTKGSSAGAAKKVVDYGEPQVGDYGWDPLSYYTQAFPTKEMQLVEIKHGRAAMMAITGFAVQEFLWGSPVVAQTPWFFGR